MFTKIAGGEKTEEDITPIINSLSKTLTLNSLALGKDKLYDFLVRGNLRNNN